MVQVSTEKLCHSVILDGWVAVNKALKELKKKRHAKDGFYPVVTDLGDERYHVQVYQTQEPKIV